MYLSVLHTERLDFQRYQCGWFGRYFYAYLLAEIEMFPDLWKKKNVSGGWKGPWVSPHHNNNENNNLVILKWL